MTEEIGAYFWQRDEITNTCLRFGAGLRPIDEMRKKMAEPFCAVRALIESLQERTPEESQTEIQRMRTTTSPLSRWRMLVVRWSYLCRPHIVEAIRYLS